MSNDLQTGATALTSSEKKARMGKAFGVMAFVSIILGAGAGAFFAWNVRPIIAAGVGLGPFAGVGAALGAIVAFVAFRIMFENVRKDGVTTSIA